MSDEPAARKARTMSMFDRIAPYYDAGEPAALLTLAVSSSMSSASRPAITCWMLPLVAVPRYSQRLSMPAPPAR